MARARTLTLKTQVEVTGVDKLNNLGKKMQKTGAILSAAVTLPLLALGKAATDAASDLNESLNAVNVTFGETADEINKIGETSAESFGLSQRAFNEAATQFSAFAHTIAGEGGDVAGVVEDITGRASDFASVFNIEVSDALRLFQSGLAGETEPLRKFGIDLSSAAVDAHALATGISDGVGPLTEAEKVQARYSLLLEETSKTQGDFARTSGDAANAQRIATARMEDAAAALGQKFLPIQEKVIEVLSDAVDFWTDLDPAVQDAVVQFGIAAAVLGPLLGILGSMLRTVRLLAPALVTLGNSPVGWAIALAAGLAVARQEVSNFLDDELFDTSELLKQGFEDFEFPDFSGGPTGSFELEPELVIDQAGFEGQIADFGRDIGAMTSTVMLEAGVTGASVFATEIGKAPEQGADALLANQYVLTGENGAIAQLIAYMKQALTPAQQMFNAQGFLQSQELADGLVSNNPYVALKAQEMQQAAIDALKFNLHLAMDAGMNLASTYAAGIVNNKGVVVDAAHQLVQGIRSVAGIDSEPKAFDSPLRGITKWGGNLVKTYAEGMLDAIPTLTSATAAVGRAAVIGGSAMSPTALAGGSGGGTYITNYYLQWDGEPPKGRTEAEIVATLQRLSPLVDGKLAPGY